MRAFVLVLAVLLASCGAPGGPGKRDASPSPEEAQRAFEAGRAAARAGDFPRAVTLLSQAQRAAPYDPERLQQLGLAHAGAGHEAAAVAWLEAYLATGPQAPNAAEAREEIARLQEKAVAKLNKLLEHALASAERLDRQDKMWAVLLIAHYHGMAGDIERANRLRDSVGRTREKAWEPRLKLFKEARDVVGVEQLAEKAKEDERDEIWLSAAESWCSHEGLLDRAQAAIAKVSDKHGRRSEVANRVHEQVLKRDVWQGKVRLDAPVHERVRKYLSDGKIREAAELADLIPDTGPRCSTFTDVALRQLEAGDTAGARSSARKAMTAAQGDSLRPVPAAILGQVDLALKLIANGKNWELSSFDADWSYRVGLTLRLTAYGEVAYVQALLGDMAGAEAAARASAYRDDRIDLPPWGYFYLGRFHARKGRLREAFETVRRAPSHLQGEVLEEIADRMMAQGDLAGAEEVLLSSPTQDAATYRKMLGDWRSDARRQIGGLAKLAQAYRANQARDQEVRTLRLASTAALRSPYFCDEEIAGLLAKIARRQEELKDADGLAATRRLPVSKDLRRWQELAYELDGTTRAFSTTHLEAELKKAAEGDPRNFATAIAAAAHKSLQLPLARIEAARRNP